MKWALYLTLVILNVLDVLTTKLSLDLGAEEANPLLSGDIYRTVALKIAVLAIIWLLIRKTDAEWVPKALYLTVIIYAVVVGINMGGMNCLTA